jgi:hypothetical protein
LDGGTVISKTKFFDIPDKNCEKCILYSSFNLLYIDISPYAFVIFISENIPEAIDLNTISIYSAIIENKPPSEFANA